MKPSQLASQLRRIASKIDSSKNPDRTLVARDLKKVLAAVGPMAGSIIVHMHGDGEMFDVTRSSSITSNKPYDTIDLPNGDTIAFAKSLDDIKANMDTSNQGLLEALFNQGLIGSDDDGNYIIDNVT